MPRYLDRIEGAKRAKYDTCLKALQFELDLFWKRSTVFWVVIAAAAAALFEAHKGCDHRISATVASFGFVSSVVWTMANRGSKFWYENWEERLKDAEGDVTGALYGAPPKEKLGDGLWLRGRRYSPSKLAIALSDYVALLWLYLLASEASGLIPRPLWQRLRGFMFSGDGLVFGFAFLSFWYAIFLLGWLRPKRRCEPAK